jgi:RNA polymerase sigma factor (TIGR02999 family)
MRPADSPPDPAPIPTDALFDQVYTRLKSMVGKRFRQPPGSTLQTTALVHELYVRLKSSGAEQFAQPSAFFAYAARALRHLLVDRARLRVRQRAGGDWQRVALDGVDEELAIDSAEQALALDQGLTRLAAADPRAAQVVELLYFAGLTLEQTAATLGVARRTIDRDWQFARAFLQAELD